MQPRQVSRALGGLCSRAVHECGAVRSGNMLRVSLGKRAPAFIADADLGTSLN